MYNHDNKDLVSFRFALMWDLNMLKVDVNMYM